MRKKVKEKCVKACKRLVTYLKEYNKENNLDIDFHIFFVEVLGYTEEDYVKFVTKKAKQKAKKEVKKIKRTDNVNPKPRKINQLKLIEIGLGDTENPEYEKYWKIFTDYNENYLGNTSITGKKSLKKYFIYRYNYSEDQALKESRKISYIIFKKNKK